MQNLEEENNRSAVESATQENAPKSAADAPISALPVAPAPPPAQAGAGIQQPTETIAPGKAAPPTIAPVDAAAPIATAPVNQVPLELASSRLNATPPPAPSSTPLNAEAAPEQPAFITIDDFAKVDLRVARILVAERVPKADKLLRLEVDLGYEKRQILAGIAQYYEPEKLIGRKIVIVANLAPRKMRGLESNGMLLAASLPPDGSPVLAGFLEDVPLGARLK